MENKIIALNNIKKNLYNDNFDFDKDLAVICRSLNKRSILYKNYNKQLDFCKIKLFNLINNNLNNEEKFIFLIRIASSNIKLNYCVFNKEMFSHILIKYVNKNINVIIKLLKDEKICTIFSNWFKSNKYSVDLSINEYKEIFNLPKFKEIVLKDENITKQLFTYNKYFFANLPKEYGYLIGYSKAYNYLLKDLAKLYGNFYNDKLKRKEQLELIKVHYQMCNKNSTFNIVIKDIEDDYVHCLKCIYENNNYYKIIKKISKNSNIDLKYIISFSAKYDNTNFFIELCSRKHKYNSDTSKKIKYLSTREKIKDLELIDNIDYMSLDYLINLEKGNKTDILLPGGPNAADNNHKEIRRINVDGSFNILKLGSLDAHQTGVLDIYDDIKFKLDNSSAYENAIKALKLINSITFIIEGNAFLIVIPTNISIKQKNILINWIENSDKKTELGIILYNKEFDKKEIISSDDFDKKEIVEYINNLDNKNSKNYTYNM